MNVVEKILMNGSLKLGMVLGFGFLSVAPVQAGIDQWTRAGAPGGWVRHMEWDSANPSNVYAFLGSYGVAKSLDKGRTWERLEVNFSAPDGPIPDLEFGIAHMALGSVADSIYLAVYSDGVLHSSDGGATWTQISDGLGEESVFSVFVHPESPSQVYAFTTEGIYRRQGESAWHKMDLGLESFRPGYFEVDPASGSTLYLTGRDAENQRVLLRSSDGGETWIQIYDGFQFGPIDLEVDPGDGSHLWAISGGRVHRSTDGGQTWAEVDSDFNPVDIYIASGDSDSTVYLGANEGVSRWVEDTASWQPAGGGFLDLRPNVTRIVQDPQDAEHFLVGTLGSGVFRSDNAGASWSASSEGLWAANILGLEAAADGQTLFAAVSRTGLMVSEDRGRTWEHRQPGTLDTSVMSMVADPRNPRKLHLGTFGEVYSTEDAGRTWQLTLSGFNASFELALDPKNSSNLFAAASSGQIFRSQDGSVQWVQVLLDFNADFRHILVDPSESSTLYAVFRDRTDARESGIYRSRDGGDTWESYTDGLRSFAAYDLAVDPLNPDHMKVGTLRNGLLESLDGGLNWTQGAITSSWVTGVEFDLKNPSTVYVSTLENTSLMRSIDGGATFEPVMPISDVVNFQSFAIDPSEPSTLYAGTLNNGLWELSEVQEREVLWLRGGRFKAEVTWKDFAGAADSGQVAWLPSSEDGQDSSITLSSKDSTVLSFFTPDNWEALLKVLDGRAINGHHWLFLAAATDVGYQATITDTVCSREITVENPVGSPAELYSNVEAFADCDDPQPASCESSDGIVCLGDGRFRASMEWTDFSGGTGDAEQVTLSRAGLAKSGDAGVFSFFTNENWDLVLKVLDGCELNGRYWVFSVATTDVQYELKITDTETGEVWTSFNPLGQNAPAVVDPEAFPTCPAN